MRPAGAHPQACGPSGKGARMRTVSKRTPMAEQRRQWASVDEYIASFAGETRARLERLRELVREEAPQAEEKISYGMPGFRLKGMLVWFAGFAHHIGFYPGASGIAAFEHELGPYSYAKGSLQLPLDEPLPIDLIRRIVRFRVAENQGKGTE